jgi:hypothetical protein
MLITKANSILSLVIIITCQEGFGIRQTALSRENVGKGRGDGVRAAVATDQISKNKTGHRLRTAPFAGTN